MRLMEIDRKYIIFSLFSWEGKLCNKKVVVTMLLQWWQKLQTLFFKASYITPPPPATLGLSKQDIHIKFIPTHTWSLQLNRLAYLTIQPPNNWAHYKYSIGLCRISWWRLKFLAVIGEKTIFCLIISQLSSFLITSTNLELSAVKSLESQPNGP